METDWGKIVVNLSNIVAERASKVALDALRYTAADVRRAAQRSIKSGGKTRQSKNWQTSRPGEPPRSHKGTVKQTIQYARQDGGSYLIGPTKVGASKALKTLEYGGTGEVRTTFYDESYLKRRRQSARKRKSPDPVRPRAKKPYRVASRSNHKGVMVRDYLYFKNSVAWSRATASAGFQAWASRMKTTETQNVRVAPRPFMRPALQTETTDAKNRARMTRAIRRAAQ